jgi:hypothetical protein
LDQLKVRAAKLSLYRNINSGAEHNPSAATVVLVLDIVRAQSNRAGLIHELASVVAFCGVGSLAPTPACTSPPTRVGLNGALLYAGAAPW